MNIQVAHIKGRPDYAHLNVSGPVGAKGGNAFDDVMLIQGFFNYLTESSNGMFTGPLNLGIEAPEITGQMDGKTFLAIMIFQNTNFHFLTGKLDMTIHPANYRNRELKNTNKVMCITRLNLLAQEVAHQRGKKHFAPDMKHRYTQLKWVIERAPWELEESAAGKGF